MGSCSITNLGSCLPEKFFEYLDNFASDPINGFMDVSKNSLIYPVEVNVFSDLWWIIISIIGAFYLFMFLHSAFLFITSGLDPVKRTLAKESLVKTFTVIILVSASYYIYQLLIEISSVLAVSLINQIPESFFIYVKEQHTAQTLVFSVPMLLLMLIEVILLIVRYLLVCLGVVFFPLGIFLSFNDITESYGKAILNFLAINLTIPFILSILLLVFSRIIDIYVFDKYEPFIQLTAHLCIVAVILLVWTIAIFKGLVAPVKRLIM